VINIKHNAMVLLVLGVASACVSGRASEGIESRVSKLVEKMTKSPRAEKKAFRELEEIGEQAAPFLVAQLGDMRPLASNVITLENTSSNAFEGSRHYSPETVHDALSAILNQLTGQSFVFVYNGATRQQRDDNRRRWVEWCRATYPDAAVTCGRE
jgi:hypothetical protein